MHWPLLILVLYLVKFSASKNVLVLCPLCSISHKTPLAIIGGGLAERNHSVTIVSAYETGNEKIRDILPFRGFDFLENMNIIEARKQGPLGQVNVNIFKKIMDSCHATFQNTEFRALQNETWDLVVTDIFANHCLQGFIYTLNAPVIWSSPLPFPSSYAIKLGTYYPSSFVPDVLVPFGDKMNIWERIGNIVIPKLIWGYYFSYYSEYERIYRKYLGDDIPGLEEIERNVSMVLVNSDVTMSPPRPAMPDIVEVAGVHCRPGRPLPMELEEFISGAKDGVIVFSLGSIVKWSQIPEETTQAFLNAFSRLKQRVLWKRDEEDIKDLPSNVKLSKWLPLQDLLAHPNTKLFITHGGLLSTQEAIYHHVPLIGLPVFADQDMNINRYVDAGMALKLEILGINKDEIFDAIDTVVTDNKYRAKIQKLSSLFRDQPQPALERAIFWAEYVMRHKGAPHLRSAARNLSTIQYYSVDVIAILATLLFALIAGAYLAAVKILRKVVQIVFSPRSKDALKKTQ